MNDKGPNNELRFNKQKFLEGLNFKALIAANRLRDSTRTNTQIDVM